MGTPHVTVLGGGLAGSVAALALRAHGLPVTLSMGAPGATMNFSGAWHLALSEGELKRHEARLARHVEALARHAPGHPFARLGAARAEQSLAAGAALLLPLKDEAPLGGVLQYVPHAAGTLVAAVPAAGVVGLPMQASSAQAGKPHAAAAAVAVLDLADWGVPLSPRALAGWRYEADSWQTRLPCVRSVRVPLPPGVPAHATANALGLANWLTDVGHLQVLAAATKAVLRADDEAVWCPAVLGMERAGEGCRRLAAMLERPVAEVAGGHGTWAPAWRRQAALAARLKEAGVAVVGPTASVAFGPGAVATLQSGEVLAPAGAVVLATGRFLAGGWRWPSQGRPVESICGLELTVDDMLVRARTVGELTALYLQQAQSFLQLGLATDGACAPLASSTKGLPAAAAGRLFVAGISQLGTWLAGGASADGIALATGFWAAERAAAAVRSS